MPTEIAEALQATVLRELSPTQPWSNPALIQLASAAAARETILLDLDRVVPIGEDATVVTAVLRLTKAESFGSSCSVLVSALDDDFDEDAQTWETMPPARASNTVSQVIPSGGAAGTVVDIPITAMLQASIAADDAEGQTWFGVKVESTSGTGKFYALAADPDVSPQLIVTYARPPEPFDELVPHAGQVISRNRPYFTAQGTDPDEEDSISAVQVQIATDPDDFESTIVFDSDYVPRSSIEMDLANLLTPNQADVETNTTGFTGTNASLARSTSQFSHGLSSLELTSTAGGSMSVTLTTVAVSEQRTYKGMLKAKALAAVRSVTCSLIFRRSNGTDISTVTGEAKADVNSGWLEYSAIGVAPEEATQVALRATVAGTAVGEKHFFDEFGVTQDARPWTPALSAVLTAGQLRHWRIRGKTRTASKTSGATWRASPTNRPARSSLRRR